MKINDISVRGLALIKEFEGFSPTLYICPAGYPTIGYGHKIKGDESYDDQSITHEIAEKILKNDVNQAIASIKKLVRVPLTQGQFDALVSLVYNIGGYAFEKSTLLRLLNNSQYDLAAKEFSRWIYCKKQKMEGLVRRRSAETLMFNRKT
jgi:lysozyme